MNKETLLCFDLGQKRIGIAVGQTITKTATPLETVRVKNNKPDWSRIGELIDEWRPDRLIVGYPLQMDNGRQPMTEMSERFVRQLDGRYHLPVDVIDERLSSYEARQRIKSTRNVDPVAAQAILETWFEEKRVRAKKETDKLMSTSTIDFDATLKRMAAEIKGLIKGHKTESVMMVGIRTGGIWVAQRLHQLLKLKAPLGELNISFYRDDFSTLGLHPEVKPSKLPVDITDMHIILVDDVLYTGRTIRAAMNEIFDYGRPASITLAVLIDRNEHELPISADVIGKSLTLNRGEHVKLSGPEPLALEITKTG